MSDQSNDTKTALKDLERELVYASWMERAKEDLPSVLNTAIDDNPWFYAMGLRDGTVIEFVGVRYYDENGFVSLDVCHGDTAHNIPNVGDSEYNFERGVQVRVSEIAWVANAPYGS